MKNPIEWESHEKQQEGEQISIRKENNRQSNVAAVGAANSRKGRGRWAKRIEKWNSPCYQINNFAFSRSFTNEQTNHSPAPPIQATTSLNDSFAHDW